MSDAFVPDLSLNEKANLTLRRIGQEGHPLLVIDDVLARPDDLVELAMRAVFLKAGKTLYPGLNAPVPPAYMQNLIPALRPILEKVFGIPDNIRLDFSSFFALATQAPNDLQPLQKVPHCDSTNPFCIAFVHYLCRGRQGGTAFYRQVGTGFESVDARRNNEYIVYTKSLLAASEGHLTCHVGPDTPGYEMIDSVDLVFNRLVIYRSHVLHSGLLDTSELSDDPRKGRLTANALVSMSAHPAKT